MLKDISTDDENAPKQAKDKIKETKKEEKPKIHKIGERSKKI